MNQTLLVSVLLFALSAALSADDLFQQSWDQAWQGNYRQAIEGYQKFARSDGDHPLAPVALFNAASIAMIELGDLKAAWEDFLKLTEKYPQTKWTAEAYHRLAEITIEQGKTDQAIDYYRKGLKIAKCQDYRMPDAWVSQMVQGCREHLSHLNDPAVEAEVYQEITENIPPGEAAAETRYNLAQAQKSLWRRDDAARTLTALMYAYPYSPWTARAMQAERELVDEVTEFPWEALEQISRVEPLARRMKFQEAYDILHYVAEQYPGTPLDENIEYGLISIGTYLTGDFETGLERMQAYLNKYPEGLRAQRANQRIELYEEVLQMKDRLACDPQDYSTHAQLGLMLLQNRFMRQAEEHFLAAREDTTSDIAYLGLGYVYVNIGRAKEGIAAFERYLENHQDDGNLYNRVGYDYMGLGQMNKALECFERYRELEPVNPNSHDSYAECMMNMERFNEAIAEYKKAIEIDPNFTNPYFMLAEIYLGLDDAMTAQKYYQQYLDLDPNGYLSAQARARLDSLSQK